MANSPCALPGFVTAKCNIVKAYLMFMVLNFLSGYIFCFTAAFRCPYSVLLKLCLAMQWRCFLLHCIYERFNPNRSLEPVLFLFACRHLACLVLESVAGYVERIRRARYRQANER